jgi:hypothetical protein
LVKQEEGSQMRLLRYFSSLILLVALAGPMARSVAAINTSPRDDDDKKHKVHRYYDRKHHDYHEWNERESRSYERWEAENRWKHREYVRRQRAEQSRYWAWRHSHPDRD